MNKNIKQSTITGCFTHRKDEIVLALKKEQDYFLRIGLNVRLPYLLLYSPINVKDPSVNFFDKIIGRRIAEFKILSFDKTVTLQIEEFSLHMTFYGKNPNVLLLDSTGSILESFKKEKQVDKKSISQDFIDPFTSTECDYLKLFQSSDDQFLEKFISRNVGGFNKLLAREVCHRSSIDANSELSSITKTDIKTIKNKIEDIAAETRDSRPAIHYFNEQATHLSLIELKQFGQNYQANYFDSLNEAWKKFLLDFDKGKEIEKLSIKINQSLTKRLGYLERSLKSISDAEKLKKQKEEAELKGNLLLTFASEIQKGAREVKLKNIFTDANEPVIIKLNPSKSVHENAQKYFERFKNIDEKKLQLSVKKDTYLRELEIWQKIYEKNKEIKSLKQAEKIQKLLIEKNILPDSGYKQPNQELSFNRVLLGGKWEIFIGKNARNNDLLTFKFAHKFDLWFHAQGVSGSHVIIHLADKNKIPPREIMEQTASIAAFNSGAKNSSIVPVNYTEVRYVRKPRKATAGTVIISGEKTLFVKPIKFI